KAYHADRKGEYAAPLAEQYRALTGTLKRPAEAAAAAVECARLFRGQPGRLYDAARDLARCLPLVSEGESEHRRYAALALAELRSAVAAGFRDGRRLAEDPEWEPLRERPEFRDLLRQVQARAKQKQ